MSIQILKEIKEAEFEAERIEKESMVRARELISETKREAYETVERTIQDSEKEAKEILERSAKEAENEIEGIEKQIDEKCKIIREEALGNVEKAVQFIKGRIVK